jgi:hypothetical protein
MLTSHAFDSNLHSLSQLLASSPQYNRTDHDFLSGH